MKRIMLMIMLGFASLQVQAGKSVGNGGDAVVCYNDSTRTTIKSVKMFDYWEQDQVLRYAGGVDLGAVNLSVQDKIKIATTRLAQFDPTLSQFIERAALNLANNISSYLITRIELPEIEDATPQVVPQQPNCFIEQYAVQYKDVVTGQRRFQIADKFYNFSGTSNDDKAGILLHEAIYRYAILLNAATNSDGVRKLNYIIATRKIGELTVDQIDDYVAILASASLNNPQCVKVAGMAGLYLMAGKTQKTAEGCFFDSYDPCYNQKLNFGAKFSLLVKPHACVHGDSSSAWMDLNANLNIKAIFEIKDANGAVKTYTADSVGYSSNETLYISYVTDFYTTDKYPSTPIADAGGMKIFGPLKQAYACGSATPVRYSLKQNLVTSCRIEPVIIHGEKFTLGELHRLSNTTWQFYAGREYDYGSFSDVTKDYGNNFLVLGSKYNTKISAANGIIDENFNLVSSDSVIHSLSIKGNDGNQYILPGNDGKHKLGSYVDGISFKTSWVDGVYNINFVSGDKVFDQPQINNLRLINSTGASSGFCGTRGYKNEKYSGKSEYINFNSESFYDLGIQKKVYKTDEDVYVINQIKCEGGVAISTTEY